MMQATSDAIPSAATLQVQSVSYRYPQIGKIALSSISHSFGPGATAIVGPNGAGKSTLVKLLAGLLVPTSGEISAHLGDGTTVPPDQLHVGVLFQESSHLCLSIRQNITMRYEPRHEDDRHIRRALTLAGLGRVIDELPDGIETVVGAGFGGRTDLSGGQWQRLALARLIYQDAPVIILDEPVASLDPEGERALFQLMSHRTDKIIIFTTHRYDSIPPHTPVLVLVDGRVSEAGTHAQLLQQQRDYWSLYMSSRTRANGQAHTSLEGVTRVR